MSRAKLILFISIMPRTTCDTFGKSSKENRLVNRKPNGEPSHVRGSEFERSCSNVYYLLTCCMNLFDRLHCHNFALYYRSTLGSNNLQISYRVRFSV